MDIFHKHINLNGRNTYIIDCYADTHIGSSNFDERLLKRDIDKTLQLGNSWVFLDDMIDGITPEDRKRWNPDNVCTWVLTDPRNVIKNECELWGEYFSPIMEQSLFCIAGHTSHYQSGYIADPIVDVLKRMNITHYRGMVYAVLNFSRSEKSHDRKTIEIIFGHGNIAGGTDSNKIIQLERRITPWNRVNALVFGHGHTKIQTPPMVYLYASGNRIKSIYKRAAMTGSYLRTYTEGTCGYGESKTYNPVALGHISLAISPWSLEDQKVVEIINC